MRVFISWSGEPSRMVAEALRKWLPVIMQSIDPWMSGEDIDSGRRWGSDIEQALAEMSVGILCLTRDNQRSPWVLFEAGALAKTLSNSYVCPYLIHMAENELERSPLTQFQATLANEKGTRKLLATLNSALGAQALPQPTLDLLFERFWPDLERVINEAQAVGPEQSKPRPIDDMVAEVVVTVREVARVLLPPHRLLDSVLFELAVSPDQRAKLSRLLDDPSLSSRLSGELPTRDQLDAVRNLFGGLQPPAGRGDAAPPPARAPENDQDVPPKPPEDTGSKPDPQDEAPADDGDAREEDAG